MNVTLSPEESIHTLPQCGYKIIQKKGSFFFGIDAILLTYFAHVKKTDAVVDLGTGTGIIPVLKAGTSLCTNFTGVELQDESALTAQKTVALNGLEDRIKIIQADIRNLKPHFKKNSADVVISNPPYTGENSGVKNKTEALSVARHETSCTIRDVAKTAAWLLNSSGRFFMIHKPSRLEEIFAALKANALVPKRMRFVQPALEKAPNLVLIEAVKNAHSFLKVEAPLVVYKAPGTYSDEVQKMYNSADLYK